MIYIFNWWILVPVNYTQPLPKMKQNNNNNKKNPSTYNVLWQYYRMENASSYRSFFRTHLHVMKSNLWKPSRLIILPKIIFLGLVFPSQETFVLIGSYWLFLKKLKFQTWTKSKLDFEITIFCLISNLGTYQTHGKLS